MRCAIYASERTTQAQRVSSCPRLAGIKQRVFGEEGPRAQLLTAVSYKRTDKIRNMKSASTLVFFLAAALSVSALNTPHIRGMPYVFL